VRHLIDPLDARLTYALFLVAIALEFILPIRLCFEVLFPGDSLGPILGESMVFSLEALKLHGVLNMAKGLSCPETRTQSKCAQAPRHKRSFLATPEDKRRSVGYSPPIKLPRYLVVFSAWMQHGFSSEQFCKSNS
jgi:hypothetical protein